MSNYARYRNWHLWIGLILMIPISVIATTGFLWNHEKSLGLKHEGEKDHALHSKDPQSARTFVASPGAWSDHAAAIDAALSEGRRHWGESVGLERIELKSEPGLGLVVKVKIPEDAGVLPYEIVWSADSARVIEMKGDPKAGTDWAMVVHDLHTGKFFSKSFGFVWSDSSALALLALGMTGIVLYSIPVLKKRAKRGRDVAGIPAKPKRAVAGAPVQKALVGASTAEGQEV